MSICIQVVNTPELEHLERREFNLPIIGGSFGRSLECDIQLPDHSNKLSRVHAKIILVDNGDYLIKDLSSNGLKVNQKLVGYGNICVLKDGDILEMADYQMFVSNFSAQVKVIKNSQPNVEKQFSMGFLTSASLASNGDNNKPRDTLAVSEPWPVPEDDQDIQFNQDPLQHTAPDPMRQRN